VEALFSSNKQNKKVGSPSSFWRKRQFISLNSSVFIENLPSSECARARARANHANNDAQKGSTMQLNGITLKHRSESVLPNKIKKNIAFQLTVVKQNQSYSQY